MYPKTLFGRLQWHRTVDCRLEAYKYPDSLAYSPKKEAFTKAVE
jgi:hypothetical protein